MDSTGGCDSTQRVPEDADGAFADMFYHLLTPLREWWFGFNVFRYITFRAAMSSVTAFLLTLVIAPFVIRWLTALKVGQRIRQEQEVRDLYELHRHKDGTPTLGGVLILLALVGSTLLWADLLNLKLMLAVAVTVACGILGFWDDLTKLRQSNSRGLSARTKLVWQILIGFAFLMILLMDPTYPTSLEVPFVKESVKDLGLWYILFALVVVV